MRLRLLIGLAAGLAASSLAAAPAFAHGGSYQPPPGGGGPGGPPPGPADDPSSPITRWETWWANNKYLHLRLGEGMREGPSGPVTQGAGDRARTGGDGPPPERDRARLRAEIDELVRELLVPLFVEGLSDDSFEVRTAAAVALGKTGDPAGYEPLVRSREKDTHQDVRDSAILGLGLLGQQKAVPYLDAVLRDEKATTRHRSFAAFSLGLVGGPDASKALVTFMHLGGEEAGGLRHRGDPPLLASCFLGMGFAGDPSALATLRRAGEDRGYDIGIRAFCWLALGKLGDRASLPVFVRAVRDRGTDSELRRAAAVVLQRLATAKDAEAVEALSFAVRNDNDPVTRHFAAVALGTMADEEIVADLRKWFPRCDDRDRVFVALALALAHDAESAPVLRKALRDERNDSERGGLAIALGLLPDRGAREVLEAQVKDAGSVWPRGYAALAIGMARISEAAPVLRKELVETNDPRLRVNLAVGLGLLQDAEAKKWFLATLRDRAKGTLYDRAGAAMAMGILRMNSAVPDLVAVYRDKSEKEMLRAFSVVALGVLADPSDPPKLARFTVDSDYSLRTDPLNEVMTIY